MIKYLIFDWGGVCTRGHLVKDFSRKLEAKTGFKEQEIKRVFDGLEDPYEIGKISPRQFWNEFREKLKLEIPTKEIQEIFLNSYNLDQGMLDYILKLRRKYKTILLTNNYEDMLENLKKNYRIGDYFDKIFSSSEINCRKPDKEAYDFVIDDLEIIPSEAIFIDDKENNIRGAQAAGMKGILFKNTPGFKWVVKNFMSKAEPEVIDYVETSSVTEGVECDVYGFVGDESKDLGIIRVKAGHRTPLQRVLKGERTIEGYIFGKGNLEVIGCGGERKVYTGKKGLAVDVKIGELMQWLTTADSDLEVYEICFPPYENGRFENLA